MSSHIRNFPTREAHDELLTLIAHLQSELWDYWLAYHDEHCGHEWPHPKCYYPPPPVLLRGS